MELYLYPEFTTIVGYLDPRGSGSGKLDLDPNPHQIGKLGLDPDPHQSGKVILEHWRVQIWEKVSGRIRIRIKLKARIRSGSGYASDQS